MTSYFAAEAGDPLLAFRSGFESGARSLLFEVGALPPAFFDLRTGIAGELAQKLVSYGLRMAAVVPDLEAQPLRFQEFAREANRGQVFRFLPSREEAIAWLEADEAW